MRIIFFGTSAFAADILFFLIQKQVPLVAIVTKIDQPQGRSQRLLPSPVKKLHSALSLGIPLYQPKRASTPEFTEILKAHTPDLFLVVAYGEILKPPLFSLPTLGSINLHASLLPKYRGAAPIQRSLMEGSEKTGITIIRLALEMDAGEILEQVEIPLSPSTTYGELALDLSTLSHDPLLKVIRDLEQGTLHPIAQNPAEVTFAPKLIPQEEEIDWKRPASALHNLIRALSPLPGAWSWVMIGSYRKRLKIFRSRVVEDQAGVPGHNLSLTKQEWIVACGEESLALLEVQLEGKKRLPIALFLQGVQESLIDFLLI